MTTEPASTLRIRTPEGVVFSYRIATPISRMLAWSIDSGIITLANMSLAVILLQFLGAVNPDWALAGAIISQFSIGLGYWILMEWKGNGRSLGKRVLGLRVMDAHGLPLDIGQIVLRTLLRLVDAFPGIYALGGTVAALSPHCRRLGDIVAGCVVVHVSKRRAPDLTAVQPGKYNSFRAYPLLAARLRQAVNSQLAGVALDALRRREGLEPQARLTLFAELADYFRGLVPFPEDATAQLSDEQYVRNVVEILYVPAVPRAADS